MVLGDGVLRAVVLDDVDRGWRASDGEHVATNRNTFTGYDSNPAALKAFRSWLLYDLPELPDAIYVESVTLRLDVERYVGPDASEPFSVWDVVTDSEALTTSGPSPGTAADRAIYADLGSGRVYGSGSVTEADVGGPPIDVELNAAAAEDVSSALGGSFAVGFNGDEIRGTVDEGFRWSDGSGIYRIRQLVIVYRATP